MNIQSLLNEHRRIHEAKLERNLSSRQKEVIRNHRRFGDSTAPITHDQATQIRRRFTSHGRGIRNIPGDKQEMDLTIPQKYNSKQIRDRIHSMKARDLAMNNIIRLIRRP